MTLYKNKYRIESARLSSRDYAANGYYFITICTHNRECGLGKIVNGRMLLSETGEIVLREWNKSFEIRRELYCDCFVIMPNHIHAVVVIDKNDHDDNTVETHSRASLQNTGRASLRQNDPKSGVALLRPRSVSSFVAGFKSSATKQINEYRHTPGMPVWQPRFHDHIIRNENELNRIRQYILHNPAKWPEDKFNSVKNTL